MKFFKIIFITGIYGEAPILATIPPSSLELPIPLAH